ncbi:hypothetical protein M758_12G083800 [Ceratodon purpureus]|nr:hypothetical protein M758_12G083800 [Ceratodon purpureus]
MDEERVPGEKRERRFGRRRNGDDEEERSELWRWRTDLRPACFLRHGRPPRCSPRPPDPRRLRPTSAATRRAPPRLLPCRIEPARPPRPHLPRLPRLASPLIADGSPGVRLPPSSPEDYHPAEGGEEQNRKRKKV